MCGSPRDRRRVQPGDHSTVTGGVMFTLLWLIILGIAGSHWHELHPWTTTFVILVITAVLDTGSLGGTSMRARR